MEGRRRRKAGREAAESSQRSKGKSQEARLRAGEGRRGGKLRWVLLVQVPKRGLERLLFIGLLQGLE
jgi:hypothetical protein